MAQGHHTVEAEAAAAATRSVCCARVKRHVHEQQQNWQPRRAGGRIFFSCLVSHGNAAGNPRRVGAGTAGAPTLTAFLCCDENGPSARLGLREAKEEKRTPPEGDDTPPTSTTHLRRMLPGALE
ncbi:unnamed protein product, partial [Ectocarpus sp. 12 AP-2014]